LQIPNSIARKAIILEDQFFDLNGLAAYSSLGKSSLRYHIRENGLPCYSIRNDDGKVSKLLIKRSEFDRWMQQRWRDDLDDIANEVLREYRNDSA
jgi:hypothetical protein